MEPGALHGILELLAGTATMAAVIGAVLYAGRLADLGRAAGRRLHVVPRPDAHPAGRPIEQIADDVARLRRQLRAMPPDAPAAKRDGWRQAYDDVLAECCLALGVENLLESAPAGAERDAERLRLEHLLGKAGLRALGDVA